MKAVECMVPLCPAVVADGGTHCPTHKAARTAKMLGVRKLKCAKCRRAFKADDYVTRQAPYTHIACEPKKPKAQPTGIPLLEDL
jgi:hypothetical protein